MKILDICNLGKYIYLMNKIKKKKPIYLINFCCCSFNIFLLMSYCFIYVCTRASYETPTPVLYCYYLVVSVYFDKLQSLNKYTCKEWNEIKSKLKEGQP